MPYKIIFMGTGEFGAAVLKKLAVSEFKPIAVITQPDKPVGRRQTISPSPAKCVALEQNISVFGPKSLKNEEAEKLIKSLEPDLIGVADYGKIIPKNILDIPKFGVLNIHPSLLPKHRGASPVQYTIFEGDAETGVTIILMDEQMDHGPIVNQISIPDPVGGKNQKLTSSELLKILADAGADLLLETIPKWLRGKIEPVPQDDAQATFTKILAREDGKIDWQKSAEEIERRVRAFERWPGSWCNWQINNKRLNVKIFKVSVLDGDQINQNPGLVSITGQKEMAVRCGLGSLKIKELQLEGKRKMSGQEFLRGYPKIIGQILI